MLVTVATTEPSSQLRRADLDILGGDGYITNLHVTDLNVEGPVPVQTCAFRWLKELDLDGGNMTGTIPEFLTTCFPRSMRLTSHTTM